MSDDSPAPSSSSSSSTTSTSTTSSSSLPMPGIPPARVRAAVDTLISEYAKFQDERQTWQHERQEMLLAITKLEAWKKEQEKEKLDLYKKIQILEYGLREERARHHQLVKSQRPQRKTKNGIHYQTMPTSLSKTMSNIMPIQFFKDFASGVSSNRQNIDPNIGSAMFATSRYGGAGGSGNSGNTNTSHFTGGIKKKTPGWQPKHELKEQDEDEDSSSTSSKRARPVLNASFFQPPTPGGGTPSSFSSLSFATDHSKSESSTTSSASSSSSSSASTSTSSTADTTSLDVSSGTRKWRPKLTLRNHLDSVRCVSWETAAGGVNETASYDRLLLLSGSEDGTAKLWNLSGPLHPSNKNKNFINIEPLHSYRGHIGMVTSVLMHHTTCYTAGIDGRILQWQIPPTTQDIYGVFGQVSLFNLATFPHSDAVWSLAAHPMDPLLFSASSDGNVCIWKIPTPPTPTSSTPTSHTALHSISSVDTNSNIRIPVSVTVVPTDSHQLLVGYTSGELGLVDIESGKVVTLMSDTNASDIKEGKRVTQASCHPTLSLSVSGHVDSYLRFFDLKSATCVNSVKAHRDVVTSVHCDPHGLYCVSASHDQSVRFWDLTSRKCVQDMDAHKTHRGKYAEAVHAVTYHPTIPVVASAGADSIVKCYTI